MRKVNQVVKKIFLLMVLFLVLYSTSYGSSVQIKILKGNKQKVQVGKKAKIPLKVQVLTLRGYPVSAKVTFKVIKGEGKVKPSEVSTSSGVAKTYFTAGFSSGKTVVRAKALGKYADFIIYVTLDNPYAKPKTSVQVAKPKPQNNVNTESNKDKKDTSTEVPKKSSSIPKKPAPLPGNTKSTKILTPKTPLKKPSIIIGYSGNNQRVLPEFLGKNLEVQVMDEDGNPMPDVAVTFSVVEGEGTVNPTRVVTDKDGIASVSFKAGKKEGIVSVKASVDKVRGLSTMFNIEVTKKAPVEVSIPKPVPRRGGDLPKPPKVPTTPLRGYYSREPVKITVVGGNYQKADPGARLPAPIVVYVTDADGNPTEATVQFTALSGDATIVTPQVKTDKRGLASTFVIVNSPAPIKIVAEVMEKPGLSTIAYANTTPPDSQSSTASPVIKAPQTTAKPGYPTAIAFYQVPSMNVENIEKTRVIPLQIGVTDFMNQPVSTPIRFTVVKGNVKVLTPVVQTDAQGKGTCYVDIGNSMGIFTIEAQSLENPDLKAIFKSGPQIRSAPANDVVRPGLGDVNPNSNVSVRANPPVSNKSGKPALIAVMSGAGQKGKIGTRLPKPIEVLVTDSKGNPVPDALVSFVVIRGKAKIEKPFARTGPDGTVSTYVTLGKRVGTVEIVVRVRGNRRLRTTLQLKAVK